ncbi:MAG TPA: NTP transferase domain-containing protein [Burkholderiaceae bacterium]|nr:NTP transferase domain-containing protein [Burkholderiaceae bacterium]
MAAAGPTLLVLAAGLGSRFGSLKQSAPMGPGGQTLVDYAVFDAYRAGFARVVFVLGASFAEEFTARAVARYGTALRVDCVLQRPDDLPAAFAPPAGRHRPWGTTHAVLAARDVLDGPFGVINADDFYGRDAYGRVAAFFAGPAAASPVPGAPAHWCMVGYRLDRTLSDHGGVNRGICMQREGRLVSVEEHRDIVAEGPGRCRGLNARGERVAIAGSALASMNFWGFTPDVFEPMQRCFADFLRQHGHRDDAECYIPSVVDTLVRTGQADCRILPTDAPWFGVTYAQDTAGTARRLHELAGDGTYPHALWP